MSVLVADMVNFRLKRITAPFLLKQPDPAKTAGCLSLVSEVGPSPRSDEESCPVRST